MKKAASFVFSLATIAAGLLLYSACETSSANDPRGISVSPSSAYLAPGQNIVLTAKGGWNYSWSVDDPSLGHLISRQGPTVTYVAHSKSGTQVVTVSTNPKPPSAPPAKSDPGKDNDSKDENNKTSEQPVAPSDPQSVSVYIYQ